MSHLSRNGVDEIYRSRIAQVCETRPPLVVTEVIDCHVFRRGGWGLERQTQSLALGLVESPIVHVQLVDSGALLILQIGLTDEAVKCKLLHICGAVKSTRER